MRMMRVRQLQGDVNEREEAELRRLEGGLQVGGEPATTPWTKQCLQHRRSGLRTAPW